MDIKIDKNKGYGFMPGCSLASYNPEAVAKTIEYLNSIFPKFSVFQKCCGKPTKYLGQQELFKKRFQSLEDDINNLNINEMIVACQNCKVTLKEEKSVITHSLWQILPLIGLPEEVKGKGKHSDMVFTIHDSCVTRKETELQDGVRWIMDELGYKYVESKYAREKTLCCGSGGMVLAANPDLGRRVIQRRVETLEQNNVVVYCAECGSSIIKGGAKAWHILDLLWGPVVYSKEDCPANVLASPVKAWRNRYRTKKKIEKNNI
jgi:Fe-S oxidoreductase